LEKAVNASPTLPLSPSSPLPKQAILFVYQLRAIAHKYLLELRRSLYHCIIRVAQSWFCVHYYNSIPFLQGYILAQIFF
jgi:hypothetical protein